MSKYRTGGGRACAFGPVSRLLMAAGAGVVLGLSGMAQGQVRWQSGARVEPRGMSVVDLAHEVRILANRQDERRVVVAFTGPVSAAERERLERHGLKLLSYLGGNGYFGSLSREGVDAGEIARSGVLTGICAVDRAWKLHPDLEADIVRDWTIIDPNRGKGADPAAAGGAGKGSPEADKEAADPVVAVLVLFHRDAGLDRRADDLVERYGGVVATRVESINTAVVHIRFSQIKMLADEDAVQWIEPPLPRLTDLSMMSAMRLNDSNRDRTGADIVQGPPYNLTGAGVTALIYDGGKMASHADFGSRLTIGATDTSGVSGHATHVGGTVGGAGVVNPLYRGMAPGVGLVSYGFEQEGGLQQGFLYTDPGDLEDDYGAAINDYGAHISNNSIGTNTAPNGFPCEWEGNYGLTSALIDAIVRGSLSLDGSPFRVVWANGNERQGSQRCGSTYRTTAPPACAKNHITVGALNSNDDSVTGFTSWGPSDDDRIKPDISGPGCQSNADGGVTSCSSGGGYTSLCGTSMSSPTVCGLASLLLQDYRAHYPDAADPRNSTLKAIFAQTAQDIQNPGPDYQTGYGSVRIQPAVDLVRAGNFAEAEVSQDGAHNVVVVVNPGDPELKITIAWDDYPSAPNPIGNLVNDLDLVVTSPSGVRHYPWTLGGLANPAAPAVRTAEDHVNNIEQVFVENPEAGGWLVEIRGTNVPEGPQPVSIAASPFLVNCSSQGVVSLDKGRYPCTSTALLKVVDCDLNTSDEVVDTVVVTIVSDSEPSGETVVLTESAPAAAAFLATISLSETDAAGVLHVSPGDTVTLRYVDADDGQGGINVLKTDVAVVDCTSPVIFNVAAADVQPRSATIAFETDEPATGLVRWGTSCGDLSNTVEGAGRRTEHAIAVSGLQDNTTYYFEVSATDEAGNEATADNQGECFVFTTPEVPDFYTEEFLSASDLQGLTAFFAPNGSNDFYSACVEPLNGQLPTDPAGGTALSLSDDSFREVAIGGGMSVPLYGASHTRMFVGSNGYVTFVSGDTDYTESLADHFDLPRISACFDDLNPSVGGQVRWQQFADRMVVSWVNVPEYGTNNQNTFQIEMYFDGSIRVSWLTLASQDHIAGLSAGNGLDPDFFESDLSGLGSCGPRPPVAQSQSVTTEVNAPLAVVVSAVDDGLPDPPAAITYIVSSLPLHGRLYESGVEITSVPFEIPGGGNEVEYRPTRNYSGTDSFTFVANDGGEAPEGGDSNPGTILITVGGPQVIYEFLVDDTDPGFAREDQWGFGRPTGTGDPAGGFTGQNVYGYNLAGNYPNNMPRRALTSPPLDLSDATGVTLEFRRWLQIESASFDHASVEVSNDGVNWTVVWNHTGPTMQESTWSLQTFDISAVADNEPAVRVRWIMGTTDVSVVFTGWNIDDIRIIGLVPFKGEECPADWNGDGLVNPADVGAFLTTYFQDLLNGTTDADFDGNGVTNSGDVGAFLTQYFAQLGPCP